MGLIRAPLEDHVIAPDWSDPLAMFIAWLVRIFAQITKLKSVRRTTTFKPDWRDHWQNLRQLEWVRDQILAACAARLLAGETLDAESDFTPSTDPPAGYGGPCPRTPFDMNRRFLAIARFNADPEAAILEHVPRSPQGLRWLRSLRRVVRLAVVRQADNPGRRSNLAELSQTRWHALARDGGGSHSSRGLPTTNNPIPNPPHRPHLRDYTRLPAILNRPIHPTHDEPRQPHSTYEASHLACAGASFLNDTGRRRIRRRPSSRLASPLTTRRTSGDTTR